MENWFNKTYQDTEKSLKTNIENGLSINEVNKRLSEYGFNEIQTKNKKSIFIKFLEQFKDFMIIILIIAAIVSGIIGIINQEGIADSIIILIVVIANAIIGVAQENKAEKSLEALQKLSGHETKVLRDASIQTIPSKELVKGDIVIIETGDYIPADLRICSAINLKVQESALTGESVPIEKHSNLIDEKELPIGDRANMLFSSSLVTYGRGKGIVVETGMNTEVGKIAKIISNTKEQETPLQKKLNSLGKKLGTVCLVICIVIFIIGLIQGREPISMFMTAVSLAVAAIPEGLAAVSTIVLAIGVQKMAKRNAIVKRLPAVETLGSSSVICSDKTGTLTQNKMTVQKIYADNEIMDMEILLKSEINMTNIPELEKLVHISMLCNDTKVSITKKLTGDPTETALIDMGFELGFEPSIFEQYPRVNELPFDSERKLMTTVHKIDSKYFVYTKGGVDEILKKCSFYISNNKISKNSPEYKKEISIKNEQMAKEALRVLAMAYKELDHLPSKEEMENIESDLIFVGMVGMIDPPREEAKLAVEKCKNAGIKTVMITGDHKITAIAIAKKIGILQNENQAITGAELDKITDKELEENIRNFSVYARVSPEHKVRIVKAWQKNNEIVAMTGDGVNDSPALKTADIGCAMGKVGTDVAKEAADVILVDDNFATVVSAVEEGRRIYDNILKVIHFLLSSNIGEIVVLLLATLFSGFIAEIAGISNAETIQILLPIHILWINLVTDSLPALALAFDPANENIMNRKPLKQTKRIFTKGMTYRIIYQGIIVGFITLTAFIIGLKTTITPFNGLTLDQSKIQVGQAMAFIVLSLSELIHIFNIRDNKNSIFKTNIFSNKALIGAILLSACLIFVILIIPPLREIFNIPILQPNNILTIVALTLLPIIIVEFMKILKINGK